MQVSQAELTEDQEVELEALENELGGLKSVFGDDPIKLVYGITARPDRVLEVEVVPEGELL